MRTRQACCLLLLLLLLVCCIYNRVNDGATVSRHRPLVGDITGNSSTMRGRHDQSSSTNCRSALGLACVIMPRPRVGALSDDARLTSLCRSRTAGLSREQRGLGRLKLAQSWPTSLVNRTSFSRSGSALRQRPLKEVRLQVTLEGGYSSRVSDKRWERFPDTCPSKRKGTVAECWTGGTTSAYVDVEGNCLLESLSVTRRSSSARYAGAVTCVF